MKYLVSVKDTLTTDEMGKLKHTNAFPLEMPINEDGSKPALVRQKPMQLYEPIDTMRNLGLPVLDWGEGKWKPGSDEGKTPEKMTLTSSSYAILPRIEEVPTYRCVAWHCRWSITYESKSPGLPVGQSTKSLCQF